MNAQGSTATECDFIVIGAGMAGLAAAEQLSLDGRVIVLEQESSPAFHATGRSAALFADSYAERNIQCLSRISRPCFEAPPFAVDGPLLHPRGLLHIRLWDNLPLPPDDKRAIYPRLDGKDLTDLLPVLNPEAVIEAFYEEPAADIDIHALQTALIRELRTRGGQIQLSAKVEVARRIGGRWQVTAGGQTYQAPVVINAGGAWAGQIATLFGARDPGVSPLRRTAVLVEPPAGMDVTRWPMVVNLEETMFFKPESGKVMVSPADETPCPPHDAYPEELDVATAVDRLETVTTLSVRRVVTSWAGLRTFMPDRLPSIGFDSGVEGFFWLAGQGGSGIQTAPGQGILTRYIVTGNAGGLSQADRDMLIRAFSPARFDAIAA
ncbi:FAD-binding oxidoreductase [Niveispirillum sp.]|uniref:NAD(P)/FAD-dependent oxidoreductase n=1 Tax=Niveispirillum sp. TaxID=1917217 RepID=UPI001B697824|nr:FAD-binding oxidoreductase [Niveispirillum sp.]MBP7339133.1 FAD-binding oxidoreductase [Niveispirillum sp.]